MIRSLIVPGVLVGLVSIPFVLPSQNKSSTPQNSQSSTNVVPSPFQLTSATQSSYGGFAGTTLEGNSIPSPMPASSSSQLNSIPIYDQAGNLVGYGPNTGLTGGIGAEIIPAGIPDIGAAETYFLPGDANGPDLAANPVDFVMPIQLSDVFRYDVTLNSIRSRWDRVSSTPMFDGLVGYRVALVTGTNSWDIHGSLTYYFDEYQKCQRITFRGWAGDSTRLVQLLQQHDFKKQPSQNAGFYLAKSRRRLKGALLMKHPTVMYRDNRMQQVAIVLEMNNPTSKFQLSEDFVSLVRGSTSGG